MSDLLRCWRCDKALVSVGYFVGVVIVLCHRCKGRNVFESLDGSPNLHGTADSRWFEIVDKP